jgi:TonB family protein
VSTVWDEQRSGGWIWGALGSAVLHGVLAVALFIMPAEARDRILAKVDFSVNKKAAPEPEEQKPPPEVEKPETEEEPVAAVRKKAARKPAAEEQPEEEPEPKKPPPKFQMSGETFAGDGTWSLAAEVGDSRFGSLSGVGEYEKKVEAPPEPEKPSGEGTGKKKKKGFSPAKAGEVKDKPKVVLEQQIPYPAEARKLGIEGKVRLRVDIDKKGRVVKVQVLQDPGGGLGKAAAKAIKGFLFSPAIGLSGKPVDYRITYTYVFKLE